MSGEAADEGGVVPEEPVAVELDDVGRHQLEQLERVRPPDVARQLERGAQTASPE